MPLPIVKGKAGGEGKLLCPSLRKDGQKLVSTQFLGFCLKRKFPLGKKRIYLKITSAAHDI